MKAVVLGCGGAAGVPSISGGWGACDPSNPKNRRRRPSILVEHEGTRILVDASPDLRAQLLDAAVRQLDAVLFTHDHADHLHGIDDLREVNRAMGGALDIHATADVLATIGQRFGYTLEPLPPGATSIFKPVLVPHEITGQFQVGSIDVVPFDQDHGYGRTTGFRFGSLAYSTDAVGLPDEAFAALQGVDVWIVGCLTDHEHPTHAHLDKALSWIDRVKPRRAILTHMAARLDFDALAARLPAHVEPGFDGLVVHAG
ncbi:MAG: MBL fold metallo-hydrolase [Solirubrobacterales bacterium]